MADTNVTSRLRDQPMLATDEANMTYLAPRHMTVAKFFEFIQTQETRYEFVAGLPRAMGGEAQANNIIAGNIVAAFHAQLRGKPCRAMPANAFVVIPSGNRRLPDVLVDCGPIDLTSLEASEPRVVVEVLSATTRAEDFGPKLDDYRSVPSIDTILLVEPVVALVFLHARNASGGWSEVRINGLQSVIQMPQVGLQLPLAEVYDRILLPPTSAV